MYISLNESNASGFKKWSDAQQQKYGDRRASNADDAVIMPGPNLDSAALTVPSPPPLAEGKL